MTDQEINETVLRKLQKAAALSRGKVIPEGAPLVEAVGYVPDYCHSIAAAWEIVEKIKNQYLITLWWHDGEWEIDIEMEKGAFKENAIDAPMAICKAFLSLNEKV